MRRVGSEEELCFQLAKYLRTNHPSALFHFDFGSGTKLSKSQSGRQKALNAKSWPDLLIAKSNMFTDNTNPCAGLFIELKRQGTRLTKKDGSWATKHIAEQAAVLEALRAGGYYAVFAVGIVDAIQYIEAYLGKPAGDDESVF